MKKNSQKQWFNRKWKKIAGVAFLVVIMVISIVIGRNAFQQKEEVAAHPTSTIKLDEGGPDEYQLPTDATRLTEDRLISDAAFNGYKQNDGYLLNPTKINVKGYSTVQAVQDISHSEKTDKGRVLAVGLIGSWGTGVSYAYSTSYLFLLDEDNNMLDSRLLEGTSINQTSGGYGTEVTYFQKLSDGSFIILAGSKIVNLKLNAAETSIASITTSSLAFQGGVPIEMHYNSVQVGLDNKIYYSGHWYQTGETPSTISNGRYIAILDANGNEERRVRLKYTVGSAILPDPNYMRIQHISGMKKSPNNQELIGLATYTSHSGYEYNKIVTWDASGNMLREYAPPAGANSIKPLNKISSIDERYFMVKTSSKSEIVKYTATTGTFSQVAEFPENTDLEIIRLGDGSYSVIGYLASVTGVFTPFQNFLTPDSTFVANLSSNFDINSVVSMETGLNRNLNIKTAVFLDNSRYFFSATFNELNVSSIPQTDFIDEIQAALGSASAWTKKSPGANKGDHNVYGILETTEDHKPAMYTPGNITYNVDDRDLDNSSTVNSEYGWTVRDNWLITGSKGGALTNSSSIKVYDVYDIELSLNPQPNSLHYSRLNRNPLNVAKPIEWTKLGLDESDSGPQLLTYFVSDTQNQVTTRSRWINKTTDQTVIDEDDKYALDAQNFHVALEGIGSTIPDEAAFKKFAKTMAWSLTKHGVGDGDQGNGLDEDGTDGNKLSGKVTVDAVQLKALREATVAKPYPVDVIYEPASGIKITNRVWVFATVKNTLPNSTSSPAVGPDETNGVVYYADDYSMPFRLRHGHTDDDVRSRGNIRVYDYYDNSNETAAELPTLVDMSNSAERQKLEIQSINQINNALQPGLLAPPIKVNYKWEKNTDNHHTKGVTTTGSLDITLFSDVLLHVRQIIREPSDEIVVPDEGYLTIKNTLDNAGSPIVDLDYHAQAAVKSGKTESTLDFTTFAVETDHLNDGLDEINMSAVIPEFYQYEGHLMTDQAADPNGVSHKTGTPTPTYGEISLNRSTIDNKEEFWLTIYLKPVKEGGGSTNKTPQPYSWNYKHNDLGKIKPK